MQAGDGVLGRPPPSMPLWEIDYFDLKLLEKWPMGEECERDGLHGVQPAGGDLDTF